MGGKLNNVRKNSGAIAPPDIPEGPGEKRPVFPQGGGTDKGSARVESCVRLAFPESGMRKAERPRTPWRGRGNGMSRNGEENRESGSPAWKSS